MTSRENAQKKLNLFQMMLSSSLKPEFPREITHLKLLSYEVIKHAGFSKNTREVLANLECYQKIPSAYITQQCTRNKF